MAEQHKASEPLAGVSSSALKPPKQVWLAVTYIGLQAVILITALTVRDRFELALAWIVVSIAVTQAASEHAIFSSQNAKKWILSACALVPAVVAVAATFWG